MGTERGPRTVEPILCPQDPTPSPVLLTEAERAQWAGSGFFVVRGRAAPAPGARGVLSGFAPNEPPRIVLPRDEG